MLLSRNSDGEPALQPEAQAPNVVIARGKQGELEDAVRAMGGTVRVAGDGV
jgi:hypothetical protein